MGTFSPKIHLYMIREMGILFEENLQENMANIHVFYSIKLMPFTLCIKFLYVFSKWVSFSEDLLLWLESQDPAIYPKLS